MSLAERIALVNEKIAAAARQAGQYLALLEAEEKATPHRKQRFSASRRNTAASKPLPASSFNSTWRKNLQQTE